MDTQQTHAPQPMVPALRALYEPLAPYAYAFMRFCVGATIVPHGYTKLFQGTVAPAAGMIAKLGLEPAVAWAYFVGVVEFAGGILLAIGLLTRLAAAMLAVVFAVKSAAGFFAFKGGFGAGAAIGLALPCDLLQRRWKIIGRSRHRQGAIASSRNCLVKCLFIRSTLG